MSSTNGTPYRLPAGLLGTEVARRSIGTHVLVRVVVPGVQAWGDRIEEHPLRDLVEVPARYDGARGGRA